MGHFQCCSVIFNAAWFPCVLTLKTGWVQVELCREVAVAFLLIADGALSDIMARFVRQASCPLRAWGPLLSVLSASSIASKARIWGSKISGPASRFLFATSSLALSCRLVVPDPYMAPVTTDFGMEIRSPLQDSEYVRESRV